MNTRLPPAAFVGSLFALVSIAVGARADVLLLHNGKAITGAYEGGDGTSVRINTKEGPVTVPLSDVATLTVTDRPPPPAAPDTSAAPTVVSVPAGTTLLVRMQDSVSSSDQAGKRFTAVLQADLIADGRTVVPAGTTVYGAIDSAQSAGRLAGKSEFSISLREINLKGKTYPVVTSNFAEAGQSSFGRAARGAAVGAAVGGIADGHEGAQTGAAVGVGVAVLRQGEKVTVPPGTLLEFRLTQSLTLQTK